MNININEISWNNETKIPGKLYSIFTTPKITLQCVIYFWNPKCLLEKLFSFQNSIAVTITTVYISLTGYETERHISGVPHMILHCKN